MLPQIAPRLTLTACAVALMSGCVIDASVDDDDRADTSYPSSAGTPVTSGGQPSTDGGDSPGSDPGSGVDETCGDNLLFDPGFESGVDSAWEQHSDQFGTPICDSNCTDDIGAEPFRGDHWVWIGGNELYGAEYAWVAQEVELTGDRAYLSFYFALNRGAGTGNDIFYATIDDTIVFETTDLDDFGAGGYEWIELDISDFADGAAHLVAFSGEVAGQGTLTNFFLDQIDLVTCTDDVGSGEESGSADQESGKQSKDDSSSQGSTDSTGSEPSGSTAANPGGSESSDSGGSDSGGSDSGGSDSGGNDSG